MTAYSSDTHLQIIPAAEQSVLIFCWQNGDPERDKCQHLDIEIEVRQPVPNECFDSSDRRHVFVPESIDSPLFRCTFLSDWKEWPVTL